MILVAGLAVAGLLGIAAAFYFSVRPSGSRIRGAGPDRTGADRTSRPSAGGSARSARSASPAARATGQSVLTGPRDDPGHAAAARRTRHGTSHAPARAPGPPAEPATGRQAPSVLAPAPAVPAPPPTVPAAAMAAYGVNGTPGLPRAGSQPAALLADPADAGDAAQTPRSRRRMGWRKGAEVDQELWPSEAFGGVTDEQFWDDLAADKPLATTARIAQPDSASGSRPNPAFRSQPDSGPRSQADPAPRSQPDSGPRRRPPGAVSPPDGRASLPGLRSDWTEDPLTSPAYSLRPRGAVDGRWYQSSRRSRDHLREQHEAAPSGGYRSDPLRPYGYGNPAGLVGDPRRPNGARGYGRPGDSAGNSGSPYAYPPAAGYRGSRDQRENHRR
jgi:hypothetical protein